MLELKKESHNAFTYYGNLNSPRNIFLFEKIVVFYVYHWIGIYLYQKNTYNHVLKNENIYFKK
jgi:hypothetical protein